MTIFYNGNTFKYEMENILKLFYPVRRFQHIYESREYPADEYVSIDAAPAGDSVSDLSVTVKKGDFFVPSKPQTTLRPTPRWSARGFSIGFSTS